MTRFSLITLSMIVTLSWTSSVLAESPETIDSQKAEPMAITPYALVTAAYQGRLRDRGIPAGGKLITAVHTNQVQAQDLVEGAIAQGRLPATTLNDSSYLRHIRLMINQLNSR